MIYQLSFHDSDVIALELLSTGMVVSGGLDGQMAIWNPYTGGLIVGWDAVHPGGVYSLKAHPAGYLYFSL